MDLEVPRSSRGGGTIYYIDIASQFYTGGQGSLKVQGHGDQMVTIELNGGLAKLVFALASEGNNR